MPRGSFVKSWYCTSIKLQCNRFGQFKRFGVWNDTPVHVCTCVRAAHCDMKSRRHISMRTYEAILNSGCGRQVYVHSPMYIFSSMAVNTYEAVHIVHAKSPGPMRRGHYSMLGTAGQTQG
jgi:hypothetical protein